MRKEYLFYFILIVLSTALLALGFPDVFGNPNGILMSDDLDAFKSYFNFSYHLRYGEGFKLNAVNYPYGDLLFYVNSHPVYQWILTSLEPVFPSIVDYGPAIINLSMLISVALASVFIYKILRHFSLPVWYAILLALIIQFSYPQFRRIFGHFEMVFALSFPVYWYYLMQFIRGRKPFVLATFLVIWNLFVGLIGAYLVAVNSVFSIAVGIAILYKERRNIKSFLPKSISVFVISLLPLIAIKALVDSLDWVDDRPANPWGFYNFYASPESMLQPYYFKDIFGIEFKTIFEGESYLGLPALVFCLTLLFVIFKSWFKRRKISFRKFFPFSELNIHLTGALIVLIYAMCLPFRWGLEIIPDTIPILKQFRALGRFSWPFYYVFTVFMAVYIYAIYRHFRLFRSTRKAIAFLAITLIAWGLESAYLYYDIFRNERPVNELLAPEDPPFIQALENAGKSPNDFQAILSVPFLSTNGDKLIFWGNDSALKGAMAFSYHTQLPIIQSVSPRLSFSNSLSSIQFLSNPKIRKTRLDDMSAEPILVVYVPSELTSHENNFLQLTDFLTEWNGMELRSITPSTLDSVFVQEKNNFELLKRNYEAENGRTTIPYYFQGFDDRPSQYVFSGSGAFYKRKGEHVLYADNLSKYGLKGTVELSLWMYIDERKANMPDLKLLSKTADGAILQDERITVRRDPDVFGRWVRVEKVFQVDPRRSYHLLVDGSYITVDNLLIKPVDKDLLIKTDTAAYLWNNFPFK